QRGSGNALQWELGFGAPGPDLARVRAGDRVWVTSDPAQQVAAEKLVRSEPEGRIALAFTVAGEAGGALPGRGRAGAVRAEARSESTLQQARGHGLDEALLRDKLGGLGGTPFRLGSLDLTSLQAGLHLPPGELKDLRRALTAELLPQIERGPVRAVARDPV